MSTFAHESVLSQWISLKRLPCPLNQYLQMSSAVILNKDEFLVAPHWPEFTASTAENKKVGLFAYNVVQNEWRLFMEYNQQYNPQWHRICIDHGENKIYSTGNRSSLTIIDLKTKTYHKQPAAKLPTIGSGAFILMVDDVCHIIGGSKSDKHYSSANGEGFKVIYQFKEFGKGCTGFKVIHLKSQNRLLLFGGYRYADSVSGSRVNEIWSHYLDSNEWTKLQQTIPFAMNSFGIVVTSDEKYAITFGGFTGEAIGNIVIINLITFAHVISAICVPKETATDYSLYHAIKWHDKLDDKVLVHGYVRRHSKLGRVQFPVEIVELIVSWYSVEYVFLLSTKGFLWKMKLNDILTSCTLP